jgi:hypothetical protein
LKKKYQIKIVYIIYKWNIFNEKLEEHEISHKEKQLMSKMLLKKSEIMKDLRKKLSIYNYESISIISKGTFTEVRVCRDKDILVIVENMRKKKLYTYY